MFNADIEVRSNADGTVGLRGYAAVFDSEAHGEVVRPSAFNTTLKQRDNVRLLVNHDGIPMASTKAGTMTLSVDQRGLLPRRGSPQEEHNTVLLRVHCTKHFVGEQLPTLALVRRRLPCPHGERCVQQ